MYERIGSFLPKSLLDSFEKEFAYIGVEIPTKQFFGFYLLFSLALSAGIASLAYSFFSFHPLLIFIVTFILLIAAVYLFASLAADSKGKFVDTVLPDALQLIASNMRSGLTAEKAFLVSARPEFGVLELELKRASTRITAGMPVEEALAGLTTRIKSKNLERVIWLITKGITSGGQISDLLIQLSNNLRDQQALQEETKASISMYLILILFSAGIGGPALYSVSTFIVEIMSAQQSDIPSIDISTISQAGSVSPIVSSFLGAGQTGLDPNFVIDFTMLALFFSTLFGAVVLAVISSGKESHAIKYLAILLPLAFIVFLTLRFALTAVFGTLLL
jgi:archaeal flagellar protein FlaJ